MAVMLTTVDNPYDPRLDFAAWHTWDVNEGYNTCAYLDRISMLTEEFPEEYQDRLIEAMVDEIIMIHNGALYKKLEIDESAQAA